MDEEHTQRGSFLQVEAEEMCKTLKGHVSYCKEFFMKASEEVYVGDYMIRFVFLKLHLCLGMKN